VVKVRVEVFGTEPPCAKCRVVKKIAKELAKEYDGVEVVELPIFSKEAEKYDIISSPTVVINGKIIFSGKVPSKDEFRKAVEEALKGGN